MNNKELLVNLGSRHNSSIKAFVPALLSSLIFSINPAIGQTTDVLTYHNDNARTGQNNNEEFLTTSNVNSSTFGKLFEIPVDGKVDAQPLYKSSVIIPGQGQHNVLFVATEHDSVYSFDADTGKTLWHVQLLKPGETPSDNRNCDQVTPEIGITATPTIDPTSGANGIIYVVTMSKNASGNYFQRLHALNITTGAEELGGPKDIQATFPGTGDNSNGTDVVFDPKQYKERPGLLLLNGVVYTSWSSHCDIRPYTGWVIGYDEKSLEQVSVLNLTPNGSEGAVWASDTSLAADVDGNIYFLDANGTFDTTLNANGFPSQGDFGNSFLKLSTSNNKLAVADYFVVSNTIAESDADQDLGSGGALVLPDLTDSLAQVRHLAVGAGKDRNIYLVDREQMGKFNPNADHIYQELQGALSGGEFGMPAYFNDTLYFGAVGDSIKAFQISNAKLATSPASETSNKFGYPGTTPSISASGNSNGIVWAVENGSTAVLHAYDATDLSHELYNSNQASSGRDQFGSGNKFITPTIADGKVYVGTTNSVTVFGLLNPIGTLTHLGWTATASSTATYGFAIEPQTSLQAIDGNSRTRWSTGIPQANGQYFQVDMGSTQTFSKIVLDAGSSTNDFPKSYNVYVSNDGINWGNPVASGSGSNAVTTITFPTAQSARYIKVVLTSNGYWWWSIAEFNVYN